MRTLDRENVFSFMAHALIIWLFYSPLKSIMCISICASIEAITALNEVLYLCMRTSIQYSAVSADKNSHQLQTLNKATKTATAAEEYELNTYVVCACQMPLAMGFSNAFLQLHIYTTCVPSICIHMYEVTEAM